MGPLSSGQAPFCAAWRLRYSPAHVGGLGAPAGPAEAVVGAVSPGPFPGAGAAAPRMLCSKRLALLLDLAQLCWWPRWREARSSHGEQSQGEFPPSPAVNPSPSGVLSWQRSGQSTVRPCALMGCSGTMSLLVGQGVCLPAASCLLLLIMVVALQDPFISSFVRG